MSRPGVGSDGPPGSELGPGRQQIETAVAINVAQTSGLHIARTGNFVGEPWVSGTGVLDPEDRLAAIVGGEEIEATISIHVEGEVGIVVVSPADLLNVPEKVLLPIRSPIPPAAADNVQTSVLIHVDGRARRKGRGEIHVVTLESQLLRTSRHHECEGTQQQQGAMNHGRHLREQGCLYVTRIPANCDPVRVTVAGPSSGGHAESRGDPRGIGVTVDHLLQHGERFLFGTVRGILQTLEIRQDRHQRRGHFG